MYTIGFGLLLWADSIATNCVALSSTSLEINIQLGELSVKKNTLELLNHAYYQMADFQTVFGVRVSAMVFAPIILYLSLVISTVNWPLTPVECQGLTGTLGRLMPQLWLLIVFPFLEYLSLKKNGTTYVSDAPCRERGISRDKSCWWTSWTSLDMLDRQRTHQFALLFSLGFDIIHPRFGSCASKIDSGMYPYFVCKLCHTVAIFIFTGRQRSRRAVVSVWRCLPEY